jgi:hypothetical protein
MSFSMQKYPSSSSSSSSSSSNQYPPLTAINVGKFTGRNLARTDSVRSTRSNTSTATAGYNDLGDGSQEITVNTQDGTTTCRCVNNNDLGSISENEYKDETMSVFDEEGGGRKSKRRETKKRKSKRRRTKRRKTKRSKKSRKSRRSRRR